MTQIQRNNGTPAGGGEAGLREGGRDGRGNDGEQRGRYATRRGMSEGRVAGMVKGGWRAGVTWDGAETRGEGGRGDRDQFSEQI